MNDHIIQRLRDAVQRIDRSPDPVETFAALCAEFGGHLTDPATDDAPGAVWGAFLHGIQVRGLDAASAVSAWRYLARFRADWPALCPDPDTIDF